MPFHIIYFLNFEEIVGDILKLAHNFFIEVELITELLVDLKMLADFLVISLLQSQFNFGNELLFVFFDFWLVFLIQLSLHLLQLLYLLF